jgi:ParB-like nuclease domain
VKLGPFDLKFPIFARAHNARARGKGSCVAGGSGRALPLTKLIPYARNARTHSAEQIAQIAASIREFGFTVPVLVDEAGTLIAGHGRVLGAQQLGITDVPTMVARGWTHAQIQAYRLDFDEQKRSGFRHQYSNYQIEYSRNLGFGR